MNKTKYFFLFFLLICNFSFADEYQNNQINLLNNVLSRTTLSFPCVISFPIGTLRNFSQYSFGSGIATEYFFEPQFIPNVKTGFSSRFYYQNLFTNRAEISNFYSFSLLNGIIFNFPLIKNLILQPELDFGFIITQVSATSVDYQELSDVYYDLSFRVAISLRHPFYQTMKSTLWWDISPFYLIQFEKSSIAQQTGFIISLLFSSEKNAPRINK